MNYSEFDIWEFSRVEDAGWTWRRLTPEGNLREPSRTVFDALDPCIDDARRYGFSGGFTDNLVTH